MRESHSGVKSAEASHKGSLPQTIHRVTRKHHILVRWTHWLNIPLLIGLILSGMSIYWASPVYQHKPDPNTGNFDYLADIGIWLCTHIPGLSHYSNPPNWIYNHFSLGPGMLAPALRLHWFFAYLFMLNGLLYLVGLALGGGYRALLPRLTDVWDALLMVRYYAGLFFAKVTRRARPHPEVTTKYNALQRLSYFAMPMAGTLAVLTGWAIHKPMQFYWLAALFGGYDAARIWHFWLMGLFLLFVVPHVVLVFADGWDTLRSMVTGWSKRTRGTADGK
jgi:thiosulfate reductase cytochrome b subunit